MAKRRKITAPSAEDLSRIEDEFRRETLNRPNPGMAPIAQVSAEAAATTPVTSPEDRVARAQDSADATRYRDAAADGRVISSVPVDAIQADALVRDRMRIDRQEMAELKASIAAHGLRLPVEIFARREGRTAYALLSGYRRLRAYQELYADTGYAGYKSIPALVRAPEVLGGSFTAMVEENEIRSSLSHYERGRIAVIAAQRGAFASTDEAVNALFSAASKAKRSKVRSFAVIFEELGDLLAHADGLKERDGLRLSKVLKAGGAGPLRQALEAAGPETAEAEWAALAPVVGVLEKGTAPAKTGRPKSAQPETITEFSLKNGVKMRAEKDGDAYIIRMQGGAENAGLLEHAIEHLENLLKTQTGG